MHRERIHLPRPLLDCRVRPGVKRSGTSVSGASEQESQTAKEAKLVRQNEVICETLESLQEAVNEFEQRRVQSLTELQMIAVELAIMAAGHVVHSELEQDTWGVEEFIASTVAQMALQESATIRLHPLDLQLLQTRLGDRAAPWNEGLLTLVADSAVTRGGVRLETNSGRIVMSDVVSRLAQIREQWMENLSDTQTERRNVPNDVEQLRRFPDRRETA